MYTEEKACALYVYVCLYAYLHISIIHNESKLQWVKRKDKTDLDKECVYLENMCIYLQKRKALGCFLCICMSIFFVYIHTWFTTEPWGKKRGKCWWANVYVYAYMYLFIYVHWGKKTCLCGSVAKRTKKETDQLKIHIYVYTCKQKKKHVPVWKRGETDKKRKFRKWYTELLWMRKLGKNLDVWGGYDE